MISSAANKFADDILDRAAVYDKYAQNSASSYAKTDDKTDKADFQKWSAFAELIRSFHADACRAMHAIEAEMAAKNKASSA